MTTQRPSMAIYAAAVRAAEMVAAQCEEVAGAGCPSREVQARGELRRRQEMLGRLLLSGGHVPPQTVALRAADGRLWVVHLEYYPVSSTCQRPRGVLVPVAADVDLREEARRGVAGAWRGAARRWEVAG